MGWEIGRRDWRDIDQYYAAAKSYWTRCLFLPTGALETDQETGLTDDELISQIDQKAREDMRRMGAHISNIGGYGGLDVLDFGCGVGIDAITMLEGGAHVTLCDIVQSNLDVATHHLKLRGFTDFKTFFIEGLDSLKDLKMYDVIYAMGSLQVIPPQYAKMVVDELKNHLRPDGRFIAMTYSENLGINEIGEGPYVCGYRLDQLVDLFGDDMEIIENKIYFFGQFQMTKVKWRK